MRGKKTCITFLLGLGILFILLMSTALGWGFYNTFALNDCVITVIPSNPNVPDPAPANLTPQQEQINFHNCLTDESRE